MDHLDLSAQHLTSADNVLQKAIDYSFSIQAPEGYWMGRLDSNSTMEAEFLLLLKFLGIQDQNLWLRVKRHILSQQREDGTWGQYYEGPGDLSTTVECYFALKLAGESVSSSHMVKAKEFILAKGGVGKTRVFTKIWLALFGQWSWDAIPLMPPEMIFLPKWFFVNIYSFASWARATIVPLSIVLVLKPVCPIPDFARIDELSARQSREEALPFPKPDKLFSLRGVFYLGDKLLRAYEKLPWKFGRKAAINKALNWILEHQEADGSWGGIQPPWVYSLMALKLMGYELHHPVMRKSLKGFDRFRVDFPENESTQIQACISPVWDTALMLQGLQDAGVASTEVHMQKACKWLMDKQILAGGDWQVYNPRTPAGGWAFEFDNNHYPDLDDTAEVLIAILRSFLAENDAQRQEVLDRGVNWLLSMQSQGGGWAAFDRDNDMTFLTKILFFDFGETLDPPSVDVTAHVLELLGKLGYSSHHPIVRSGLDYIYQEQESDGSWFGRWGVNYVYGIGAVLPALEAIGEDMAQPSIQRAVQWLFEHQNSDGGWGESCASYVMREYHGRGHSTASQTAWALMALISAGLWRHSSVQRGIEYLKNSQLNNGTWDEPYYTGCGFPGYGVGKQVKDLPKPGEAGYQGPELPAAFMINYNLYRHYWPLMALGRYQKLFQTYLSLTA